MLQLPYVESFPKCCKYCQHGSFENWCGVEGELKNGTGCLCCTGLFPVRSTLNPFSFGSCNFNYVHIILYIYIYKCLWFTNTYQMYTIVRLCIQTHVWERVCVCVCVCAWMLAHRFGRWHNLMCYGQRSWDVNLHLYHLKAFKVTWWTAGPVWSHSEFVCAFAHQMRFEELTLGRMTQLHAFCVLQVHDQGCARVIWAVGRRGNFAWAGASR